MDKRAWSYSALTSYETCPRRHFATRIEKSIVEPETEELRWGNRVHKAIEKAIQRGEPLPAELSSMQSVVDKVISAPGITYGEQQFALNRDFEPVGWWDKTTWVRVIIDVMKVRGDWAFVGDWKTGKVKDDSDQLELFAAVAFHQQPALQRVHTAFVWLKERRLTPARFTRADLPKIWAKFLPRVQRYDYAHEHDRWEPKPSGLCKRHCPVTTCEFHGKGSR